MKKRLGISLVIGLCAASFAMAASAAYAVKTQEGIAGEVIRFHVLANSDSEYDQNLKLKVRDKIVGYMSEFFDENTNLEKARNIITENINNIEAVAMDTLHENNSDYSVNAEITTDFFPTKVYKNAVFPAGEYETLRIVIGEGKGKNWWCVMFPPLCFLDASSAELPYDSKQELKSVLTEDEYQVITNSNSPPFKVKLKIIEIWENLFKK
ncbi:MAG: stage II sporulation protein R [Clostridiales bacterium]|jgi:stage II sporulation protein R|nr:stage II sporulation protein R [Clostridiales bacterium]